MATIAKSICYVMTLRVTSAPIRVSLALNMGNMHFALLVKSFRNDN